METETHPALEDLTAYVEQPQAPEHRELRTHIAGCTPCRQQVSHLSRITHSLAQLLPEPEDAPTGAEIPEAVVAEFVERGSSGNTADARELIDKNPRALKAALHYAAHSESMRTHLNSEAAGVVTGTASDTKKPTERPFLQRLFDWRPPALFAVPLTAAAVFAVAINLLPLLGATPGNNPVSASFQDHAVLQMQSPELPGVGFFHGAKAQEIPFDGVRLQYRDGAGLSASWQPVESAKSYTLSLTQVTTGENPLLAKSDSRQAHIHFPALSLQAGRRYQWTLTGETTGGQSFRADGGFAVTEVK